MKNEYAKMAIQRIRLDIQILKQGQIYEIDKSPGVPRCSTVGDRLEKNFEELISLLDTEEEV